MLQMVDNGIRGGIYHAIHWYAKANNKFMKDYDENKESSYLKYWDVNNLYVFFLSANHGWPPWSATMVSRQEKFSNSRRIL